MRLEWEQIRFGRRKGIMTENSPNLTKMRRVFWFVFNNNKVKREDRH